MSVDPTGRVAGGSVIAGVLASDLVERATELSGSARDLPAAATLVQRDFRLAVRSFLAVTLVVGLDDGPPVTLTLADGPVAAREVGSAFSLCLDSDASTRLTVTCYAARSGVLTDLAADLALSLELPESAVDLQPPLPVADLVPGLYGLNRFRTAHESAGVQRAAG